MAAAPDQRWVRIVDVVAPGDSDIVVCCDGHDTISIDGVPHELKRRIFVSSECISLASPRFRELIRRGSEEDQVPNTASPMEIRLPDVDGRAMQMLLILCHPFGWKPLNFDLDVTGPTSDILAPIEADDLEPWRLLEELADLAAEYRCRRIVVPLCDYWINEVLAFPEASLWQLDVMARVAAKVRNAEKFLWLTHRMIFTCESLEIGDIVEDTILKDMLTNRKLQVLEYKNGAASAMQHGLSKIIESERETYSLIDQGRATHAECSGVSRLRSLTTLVTDIHIIVGAYDPLDERLVTYNAALLEAERLHPQHSCTAGYRCPLYRVRTWLTQHPAFTIQMPMGISLQAYLDELEEEW